MDVFIYLIVFANLVAITHFGFFLVGANIYDIKQMRFGEVVKKRQKRKRRLAQPLVSVVVPAHNEETGIVRTLDSLQRSTYTNVEIIVVNDGSTDKTASVVRKYIANLTRFKPTGYMSRRPRSKKLARHAVRKRVAGLPITLVNQTNGGKASALNNGIRNYAKGKLVMCLDADSMVREDAIANMVEHFRNQRVIGVAANVRVVGKGWLGTLQRFEHMIGYRSKKFYTMTNSEFIVGGVASTYRMSALRKVGFYDTDTQTEDIGLSMKMVAQIGNKNRYIKYASDVVAMTEGVQSYSALMKQRYRWKLGSLQNLYKYRQLLTAPRKGSKHSKMLTRYRLPMAVVGELLLSIEPLLITYILFMSIATQSVSILLGAYVTITAYTLWTIWPDEHMTVRQKLRMSVSAFGIYLLFYAMSLVQVVAIYRCARNYRKIIDPALGSSTWVSPKRMATAQ